MLDIVQALPKDKDEQHTSSPNPVTSETNLDAINGQTESVLEQTNKKFNCIQEKLNVIFFFNETDKKSPINLLFRCAQSGCR